MRLSPKSTNCTPNSIGYCLCLLKEKNYVQCLNLAEQLALNGSAVAATLASQLHLSGGYGVARNLDRAESWQRKALELNNTYSAQLELGKILVRSDKYEKNHEGARRLLRLSKNYKSANLFMTLGAMFSDGALVKRNELLAIRLFMRAIRYSNKLKLTLGSLFLIAVSSVRILVIW